MDLPDPYSVDIFGGILRKRELKRKITQFKKLLNVKTIN